MEALVFDVWKCCVALTFHQGKIQIWHFVCRVRILNRSHWKVFSSVFLSPKKRLLFLFLKKRGRLCRLPISVKTGSISRFPISYEKAFSSYSRRKVRLFLFLKIGVSSLFPSLNKRPSFHLRKNCFPSRSSKTGSSTICKGRPFVISLNKHQLFYIFKGRSPPLNRWGKAHLFHLQIRLSLSLLYIITPLTSPRKKPPLPSPEKVFSSIFEEGASSSVLRESLTLNIGDGAAISAIRHRDFSKLFCTAQKG